jgi:hypothetical protein
MKKILFLTICLMAILVGSGRTTDIYSLILGGDIKQAADSLSSVSSASTRDGNLLFYAGLLETDGLQASVSPLHREQIYYRLAQYYFLNRDLKNLGLIVTEYLSRWESGRYRDEMLRYSIMVDDISSNYESALRQVDRYLLSYADGSRGQWGQIDKARVMLRYGKKIGADKVLRKLSRSKSGVGVPPALYLLALTAIAEGNTDNAVFYYSLMRESYPSAVGVDALLDRMADLSSGDKIDRTADKLTGTFYSVQLGVYSSKENAEKMSARFTKYGQKLDQLRKKISDKNYHVVYIGRFPDYLSASRFKAEHNQSFLVVAR